MDVRGLIATVRDGGTPPGADLRALAAGLADGSVSDAQAGAFAMAVCLKGLSEDGRVALTTGMRDSGRTLAWDLDGPVVDKHSTGGVGDCVSLVLAPMLAACGVYVPMISGRGLGHTGGTLDKLEAIPGVSTAVGEDRLRRIVGDVGCAIVGAGGGIAPADARLYAVRDVTATVASVDLITASILSKKLAAGLGAMVLDVKVGSGAFMKTDAEARALASALVATANGAGCATAALVTDMGQPLAPALGNAVEVAICMELLSGNRHAAPRLRELSLALGARLLALTGEDEDAARERLARALTSGAAMERFARMVHALGGPPDMAEDWRTHLPAAPVTRVVTAVGAGHVTAIDGEALGLAAVALGVGRAREDDRIDPAVGITDVVTLAAELVEGEPLAIVHARTDPDADRAAAAVRAAVTLSDTPGAVPELVLERIDP